jgi:hypothetical protein
MIQEFPICLLEPSNSVIGYFLERAFEPLALPSSHITLFWLRELQHIEIALHNKLNQDPDAVHTGLLQVMRTKMVDYPSFVKVNQFMRENILSQFFQVLIGPAAGRSRLPDGG